MQTRTKRRWIILARWVLGCGIGGVTLGIAGGFLGAAYADAADIGGLEALGPVFAGMLLGSAAGSALGLWVAYAIFRERPRWWQILLSLAVPSAAVAAAVWWPATLGLAVVAAFAYSVRPRGATSGIVGRSD